MDVILSCPCGKTQGTLTNVSPQTVNHGKCYCRFCQSYARRFPNGKQLLDDNGGTDMIQLSPAQVRFSRGQENVRCVRQTEKGALRFYAACCHQPLMNGIANPKVPFLSVFVSAMPELMNPEAYQSAIGPVRLHTFLPDALKKHFPEAGRLGTLKAGLHFLKLMLRWYVRGDAKQSPVWTESKGPAFAISRINKGDQL